jgi:tudor domain-containing protein 1/4/6/7
MFLFLGTPEPLLNFEVDGMCAAKSSDGNWYRATIVSVEEADIKVQFSDYGNSEVISKENLRILDPKFYEPCALALVASLGLVALQDDAVTKLTEWCDDKEVQITLAFGSDGWLASMHLDGVDLAMKLVNEKLATPQIMAVEEEEKVEAPAEEPISLPSGSTQVYISHIDTPGHFWLQMADKINAIEEIQAELQANADTYTDIENREMGTLCVAKYLTDDQWYRAVILDSDSDITTVRFIDYGNTDVLDNQPNLIKVIPDSMKDIDSYAVKSSVNAVPTGTGQWSEPASDFFTQLVGDFTTPVDALIVLKDITTYVDVFVSGQNLTEKLVSEGYATRSDETECGGDLPSCFASHVNSPSEFWIQLETATSELQTMESAMVDAENFPELTDKEEGVICAAKYPEDCAWYRAQVIVDGSEGTEVLFMDYGNASIANELRSLPDELKVKPALSRKCALQKPRDVKSWSRKSEIKFNELAAEGATIFNVQFIASGDISIVELYLEGKSVTEELIGLCEDQPVSERPTPVGQDLRTNGKVCHVNSVDEFYVHLHNTTSDLENINEKLLGAPEFESVSELKVGSLCAAFWDENEQWYRAKILEFCDGGYHVQFIDYGNKSKCEEFKQLPEDIASIEPLAKCCRLTTDENSSKELSKDKFDVLIAEDTATFQIEFLDSTKEPTLVKLLLNSKDVTSLITSQKETTEDEITVSEAKVVSEVIVAEKESTKINDAEKSETAQLNDSAEKTEINEEVFEDSEDQVLKESQKDEVSEKLPEAASKEGIVDDNDINTSQPDLDESLESNHTVIENKSFENKADSLNEDIDLADKSIKDSEKDLSSDTLEQSDDTIKSPEREESKDSINTDTGYTSDSEKSPEKESVSNESPAKKTTPSETQSPKKEVAEEGQNTAQTDVKEVNINKDPEQNKDIVNKVEVTQ